MLVALYVGMRHNNHIQSMYNDSACAIIIVVFPILFKFVHPKRDVVNKQHQSTITKKRRGRILNGAVDFCFIT